ncbi:GNAT family N-acetyltransferase [Micromonospora sp. M12]
MAAGSRRQASRRHPAGQRLARPARAGWSPAAAGRRRGHLRGHPGRPRRPNLTRARERTCWWRTWWSHPDGVGAGCRALMAAALDEAAAADCYKVQLLSNAARTDAHQFYSAVGFTRSAVGYRRYLTTAT